MSITSRGLPDESPFIREVSICMIAISSFSSTLRIWSRCISTTNNKFWWDDWLALAAWCCCVCISIITLKATGLGLGKEFTDVDNSRLSTMLDFTYISTLVLHAGLCFAKLSALFFYRRVFSKCSRRFNMVFWMTLAYILLFGFYTIPLLSLVCRPSTLRWKVSEQAWTPKHCLTFFIWSIMMLLGQLLDVSSDLVLLILPTPIVTRLRLPRKRKIFLIIVFTCGYLAGITSIGRMVSYIVNMRLYIRGEAKFYVAYQVGYDDPYLEWSMIEIGVSVFSISVPTWFHLFRRIKKGGLTSLFTSRELPSALSDRELGRPSVGGTVVNRVSVRPLHSDKDKTSDNSFRTVTQWQESSIDTCIRDGFEPGTCLEVPPNCIVQERTFAVNFQEIDDDEQNRP